MIAYPRSRMTMDDAQRIIREDFGRRKRPFPRDLILLRLQLLILPGKTVDAPAAQMYTVLITHRVIERRARVGRRRT